MNVLKLGTAMPIMIEISETVKISSISVNPRSCFMAAYLQQSAVSPVFAGAGTLLPAESMINGAPQFGSAVPMTVAVMTSHLVKSLSVQVPAGPVGLYVML